ncbi:MAG: 30S ribosomal protein S12 methylthiotransferase RimO [Bacteroidales bacterium]|nr:30S ribosomal protein S12 methylthiotransferase RimO [Bacteroidales bacterium]
MYTLGCSKNRVDSEHLMRQLEHGGWEVIPDALEEDYPLDVLIINTCGFIHPAREESIQYILEALQAKEEGRLGRVLIMGCLSERYRAPLQKELPQADGLYGVNHIPALCASMGVPYVPHLDTQRVLSTPAHYAYLKISEGCDRGCAYCAIPLIRGNHLSRPKEALLAEARFLAAQGVKELNLVAQDTSFYGMDLTGKRELAGLMEDLCRINGIEWIRLLYTYPQGFPTDVLRLMAGEPKICHYVDIPLQHIADNVLEAMRRNTTRAETLRLIEDFRTLVPDICLRTTLMVGHPGEDEQAFRQLLDFVEQTRFEKLGAFTYSEEEGTYGAQFLKDSVPEKIKQDRYEALMELQKGISFAYNQSRVGSPCTLLVDYVITAEGRDPVALGRSRSEAPEVDGYIVLEQAKNTEPGTFLNVRITRATAYDLFAEF